MIMKRERTHPAKTSIEPDQAVARHGEHLVERCSRACGFAQLKISRRRRRSSWVNTPKLEPSTAIGYRPKARLQLDVVSGRRRRSNPFNAASSIRNRPLNRLVDAIDVHGDGPGTIFRFASWNTRIAKAVLRRLASTSTNIFQTGSTDAANLPVASNRTRLFRRRLQSGRCLLIHAQGAVLPALDWGRRGMERFARRQEHSLQAIALMARRTCCGQASRT